MQQYNISKSEYTSFKDFIYARSGIDLGNDKHSLVTSRLGKRLRHYSFSTFREYFTFLESPTNSDEQQVAIDLLTTNETYFFREPKHFTFLEKNFLPTWNKAKGLRIWSAASSSGEEAYSIAMLLDDMLGERTWEVFGSDISIRVLQKAQQGLYLLHRIDGIPKEYLRKYCLKGTGEHEGSLLVERRLRDRVSFSQVNLTEPLGEVGEFEIIFLRNVLIYFDTPTKKYIIKQLVEKLRPGGYLFVGHSESLKGIHDELESVVPAVYRKVS